MSIIEKQSPLNLMGKVAIVTSAATPLGAQTCRTLLRHNCLVLGVDQVPIPAEERLFSAAFTHFQRLEMKLDADNALQQIVDQTEHLFWMKGFHILVTFDEDGAAKLRDVIANKISESGGGVVLNIADTPTKLDLSTDAKSVRFNTILPNTFVSGSGKDELALPPSAIPEVQECFERFRKSKQEHVDTAGGNRALSELVLFLSSSLGANIDGVSITANGVKS